ncbi:MAG: hypothetical protein EU539_00570 [Promethearchaeota archaeon]|nr:MAG: hypothetical protein EU539_00570 [Candidatus Lokiarchaeota archaeon]
MIKRNNKMLVMMIDKLKKNPKRLTANSDIQSENKFVLGSFEVIIIADRIVELIENNSTANIK